MVIDCYRFSPLFQIYNVSMNLCDFTDLSKFILQLLVTDRSVMIYLHFFSNILDKGNNYYYNRSTYNFWPVQKHTRRIDLLFSAWYVRYCVEWKNNDSSLRNIDRNIDVRYHPNYSADRNMNILHSHHNQSCYKFPIGGAPDKRTCDTY